jgi:hypothetical protein
VALLNNELNINNFSQWLSNLVDSVNENTRQISKQLPAIEYTLLNLDTVPVEDIKTALDALQSRIERLETALKNKGIFL